MVGDGLLEKTKSLRMPFIPTRHRECSVAIQGKTKNEWIASSISPRNDLVVGEYLLERTQSLRMPFIPTRHRERSAASHKWTATSALSLLAVTSTSIIGIAGVE